jgi:hypothetical protein
VAGQRARLELGEPGGEDGGADVEVEVGGLVELVGLGERLGPRKRRLDAAPRVGGDAVREEARVDAEPGGEPLDRLGRRARLAALDLADVLLREPVAGEFALRDACRDAQLPEPLAHGDGERAACASRVCGGGATGHVGGE